MTGSARKSFRRCSQSKRCAPKVRRLCAHAAPSRAVLCQRCLCTRPWNARRSPRVGLRLPCALAGVTLHLLIDAQRDRIADVPAVYFVQPTESNILRIAQVRARAPCCAPAPSQRTPPHRSAGLGGGARTVRTTCTTRRTSTSCPASHGPCWNSWQGAWLKQTPCEGCVGARLGRSASTALTRAGSTPHRHAMPPD